MANETTPKPPHPLVVDSVTRLCRYATDADIRRMEAICSAYAALVMDAHSIVERDARLQERLENQHGSE